jgi:hypothetical protein
MGRSVLACEDAVVIPCPNPDDPRLFRVHKKGFADEVKSMSDDEVLEWMDLYSAWYYKKFRRLPVLWSSEEKKVRVLVPKLRTHRSDYYAWIKHLPLPEGYWYLLTLTFYRSVGFRRAWQHVNRWVSKFLNRFRTYLKTKYGAQVSYIWVIEVHRDGFPHIHILYRMPYIQELNIRKLVEMFHSYWVDDEGQSLCAFHGVDLQYIGRDAQYVKEYVLKYLVKDHHKYWRVQLLPDGRVAYRRSSALMWLFRVRLFGMSQDIRKKLKQGEKAKGSSGYVYFGTVSASQLHKFVHDKYNIPYWYMIWNLPEGGCVELSEDMLPVLCPSAFSRASPDVEDDLLSSF